MTYEVAVETPGGSLMYEVDADNGRQAEAAALLSARSVGYEATEAVVVGVPVEDHQSDCTAAVREVEGEQFGPIECDKATGVHVMGLVIGNRGHGMSCDTYTLTLRCLECGDVYEEEHFYRRFPEVGPNEHERIFELSDEELAAERHESEAA